jgi:ATP-binding cassette subfamily F protein 3
MLVLSDVSKSFGGRNLFSGVTLQVNSDDRIGLVGPNGAGKSTLFALMLGEEVPDEGQVLRHRNARVGHLPQESAPVGEETVLELATAITPEFEELRRQLAMVEEGTAPHEWDINDIKARFDHLGGYRLEAKAKAILRGLSFREKDLHRPAREMSGGWVMRAHLARLLTHEPEILLLDEPTNHLDLEALLWFQDYLKGYPGGLLVISHDREFLNRTISVVVEISQSRLYSYRGNYDEFLAQREAAEQQQLSAFKNQQREIARLQTFADRFRAKNTKAAQAQSKLKQIERMEKIEAPASPDATVDFAFPQPQRSGLKVINLIGIKFGYGGVPIYESLDFAAERGQRIVLVGPNGAGKSTLLKILAQVLPIQGGEHKLGINVKVGYYSQYRVDMLHPERTVLEEALDTPQRVTETFVRTVLGGFLFRGDDVFKKVEVLSGGEKSRLALVKLLLDPPNLLLMDEPTTHLDLASVDALLAALDQFEGTLIFISHDVYFIRSIANHVVRVQDGVLTPFPGDYQYYEDRMAAEAARLAAYQPANVVSRAGPEPTAAQERKEQKRREAEQRQIRYRARKSQIDLVKRLEKEIADLEERQKELTRDFEAPETYTTPGRALELNQTMRATMDRLDVLSREWEAAATKLAESDNEAD